MKHKKLTFFFLISFFMVSTYASQFGAASDFTAKDLNSTEHTLFSYLNQNKHVLIEFVTTW